MARIGLDARAVGPDGKGAARSQRGLVEALAALRLPHELIAFVRTPEAAELLDAPVERVVVPDRFALQWEMLGLPRMCRRHRLDAVLTPTERLPPIGGCSFVVWLFELPTHRIAENRRRGAGLYQQASDLATIALWKPSLKRARVIVAGSKATADELERAVPQLAGHVRVVYAGVGAPFQPGHGRSGRYVFHLASDDPRDNTDTLLEAFRSVDGAKLLVGGDLGDRRPALEAVAGENVELLGRVEDGELVQLYRGAAAYVDATLYEGFGFQLLEAMACGVPVVASRAGSIPEVVGDAGILCDPQSPGELADAVNRVLSDAPLAAKLRARGLERAARFTWKQTAEGLAAALEEALR